MRLVAGAALLFAPTLAAAEAKPIIPSGSAAFGDIVATKANQDDLVFGRQVLPPTGHAAVAQSRTIYLNKNGVTLSPGNNDSRTNKSTIAASQVSIPAWNTDAATWNATVACVREIFAPFDVRVVDQDPGNVPHIEAVFGGSPTQLGMPNNVAGVSPFTTDCSIIENSIVFTFTNVIPNDARLACEIQAQEIAHSFGLDHELLASDPMTYLDYNGNRSFKNQAASCGEDTQRPCGINGSVCRNNQNSVQLLTARLGPAGNNNDTTAPTLGISSPSNGADVPPGFQIQFTATDNNDIQSATLFVDGEQASSLVEAPFVFTTSATIPEGQHEFRIDVTDGVNVKSQSIRVNVRKGALPPAGGGNNDTGTADITGGCSTGGNASGLLLALLGLAFVARRRR
jgi:MYXO-CTERM domain-containing protein